MLKTILVGTLLIGALVAQTPTPTPSPSPTPSPTPRPPATLPPTAIPMPTITPPVPTPMPIPTLWPTPTPLPTPLLLPADAPPQILAIQLSDPIFQSGELVSGTVVTSTNVSAVEVHLAGRVAHIPQKDAGIWQMSYRMPHVPFFMRGNYTAQIVALNAAGLSAQRDMTITVR